MPTVGWSCSDAPEHPAARAVVRCPGCATRRGSRSQTHEISPARHTPGGQHDLLRFDAQRAAVGQRLDGDGPIAVQLDTVDQRPLDDAEAGQTPHRVEVGEGGIPAHPIVNVDRREADLRNAIGIVEIGCVGQPSRRRGVGERPVVGRDVVGIDLTDAQRLPSAARTRAPPTPIPTDVAKLGPQVVVAPMAGQGDAAVMGGAATQHSGTVEWCQVGM